MSTAQEQLKQNIEQQTKRLLSQLEQLQALQQQLSPSEIAELRQSTLEELSIFQESLENLIKDPKNTLLESELQRTKRLIYQTIKQKFNKQDIKGKILESQVQGLRNEIKELDKQLHLKRIHPKQYSKRKRNLIVKLEQAGIELSKQESEWLKTNENFIENAQSINEYQKAENTQMKIAQESIKKQL